MRRSSFLVAAAFVLSFAVTPARQQPPPPPTVKVGQPAPDFTLEYLAKGAGDKYEQKRVSLSDFKGKHSVILAFFPATFSPG